MGVLRVQQGACEVGLESKRSRVLSDHLFELYYNQFLIAKGVAYLSCILFSKPSVSHAPPKRDPPPCIVCLSVCLLSLI